MSTLKSLSGGHIIGAIPPHEGSVDMLGDLYVQVVPTPHDCFRGSYQIERDVRIYPYGSDKYILLVVFLVDIDVCEQPIFLDSVGRPGLFY